MEDTCKESCKLYKKRDKCPNYTYGMWEERDKKDRVVNTKLVHDCGIIRTNLLLKSLSLQVLSLQKSIEQQRNGLAKLLDLLKRVFLNANDKQLTP